MRLLGDRVMRLLSDRVMRLLGDRAMRRRFAGLLGLLCTCVMWVGYRLCIEAKCKISGSASMGRTRDRMPLGASSRAALAISSGYVSVSVCLAVDR